MRINNMNQISQPIYNRGTYPKSNDGFSGVLNESEDKVKGEGDSYIPQDWQANYLAKEEAVGTQMLTDNGMIVQAGNTVQFIGRDLEEKWSVKVGGTDANPFKLMALLLNYREIRGYWKNRIFGRIKES